MERKIKIGNFEAACLLLNMISSKIILDFPRTVAEDAGTAGWLMTLLVSVAVFAIFSVISKLYKKFSGQDILDVGESAFGTVGKILAGILFLVQFLLIIPVILRGFAEDIKVISLASTPVSLVMLLFCAGMVVGAYLGLETLVRIHALLVPLLAAAFTVISIMNIPNFEFSRLAPWLGRGAETILKEGVKNLSIYSELIALFFIMPFLHKKSDFAGIGRYSLFFSALFLVFSSMCYTLVYPYPATTEYFLPMYQMTRAIRLGRFFTRIESAFIVIWAFSAFLYLSSGLYFLTWIFQKTFALQKRKPLILPFTILVFTGGIIPENLYSTLQIEMELYRSVSWIITFLLPLLLLGIATIRSRNKKRKEAAE
ncbi:MAG: endospore germination permease [Clostridiaceae bacterium]|nr:endospore germination permease [Clostridiaceae bacterium]